VHLEQRFAAGADDERPAAGARRPGGADRRGEVGRAGEEAAAGAVGADEVGVTERADRPRAVLLAAGPEVAAGEAAEDRRAAGVQPLALQGVEDLLDAVAHGPGSRYGVSLHHNRSPRPGLLLPRGGRITMRYSAPPARSPAAPRETSMMMWSAPCT